MFTGVLPILVVEHHKHLGSLFRDSAQLDSLALKTGFGLPVPQSRTEHISDVLDINADALASFKSFKLAVYRF